MKCFGQVKHSMKCCNQVKQKMFKEFISKKNLQNEKTKSFFGSHVLQIKVFAIMK